VSASISKERLASFSDGIFAVIITIMVLQLRVPSHPTFGAAFSEWPTVLSYIVSYLLIVIISSCVPYAPWYMTGSSPAEAHFADH
jgi:uncharacterized membrane protein